MVDLCVILPTATVASVAKEGEAAIFWCVGGAGEEYVAKMPTRTERRRDKRAAARAMAKHMDHDVRIAGYEVFGRLWEKKDICGHVIDKLAQPEERGGVSVALS